MPELTRRRFLSGSAAAAAAGAAMTFLPAAVQEAVAAPAPQRTPELRDIKHVVLLMQENRSFDHYYGTLSGVAGFDDKHARTLSTGRSVFYQPDALNPDGYLLPFHLDTGSTNAQAIPSTSHAYTVQHQAWNNGAMDQWLPAHRAADQANGPYVMGYYTRKDIPFQYALADAFTVCDQYHCSVMGPTWPNRLYWQTGMIDPTGAHGGPITSNATPNGRYTWTTYAERLEAAGVSWKVYQNESGLVDFNMFNQFQQYYDAKPGEPLFEKGVKVQPDDQFEKDCAAGRLPTVSWLMTSGGETEHPAELPAAGADFVARKIAAVAANPELWKKTVFILNYDENDGLFDHVVPPTPKAGEAGEWVSGLPIGGGFRVPCVVISPWTTGGYVASEKFDHTSTIRFLERITGVIEPNITPWRRRTFGDLTSVFRFGQPRSTPPHLPGTAQQLARAEYEVSHYPAPVFPGSDQTVPHQERGHRPRI